MEPTLQQLKKRKNAFIVLAVFGGLVAIGSSIVLAGQGNAAMIPVMLIGCPYVFAAYVAGFLSLPGYNAIFKKAFSIPLLGWIGALILGWLGMAVWMLVGLFTLPHQVKKLRRQLKEAEGEQRSESI